MAKRKIRLGKRIVEILDFPQEIFGTETKMTIIGKDRALIENHKGIFEYTQTTLRIKTNDAVLNIQGKNIVIAELSEERLLLRGELYSYGYEINGKNVN